MKHKNLSEAAIAKIHTLHKEGIPVKEIADRVGATTGAVYRRLRESKPSKKRRNEVKHVTVTTDSTFNNQTGEVTISGTPQALAELFNGMRARV